MDTTVVLPDVRNTTGRYGCYYACAFNVPTEGDEDGVLGIQPCSYTVYVDRVLKGDVEVFTVAVCVWYL